MMVVEKKGCEKNMMRGNNKRKFMAILIIFLFAMLVFVQAGVADPPKPKQYEGVVIGVSEDAQGRLRVNISETGGFTADIFLIFDEYTRPQRRLLLQAENNRWVAKVERASAESSPVWFLNFVECNGKKIYYDRDDKYIINKRWSHEYSDFEIRYYTKTLTSSKI